MRKKRNPAALKIANDIIAAYKPESVAEMQDAIKDVFEPMFEAILNGEMENYLGYVSNSKVQKATANRRNGYSDKKLKTSMGETQISMPRDRGAEFESMLIPKHKHDVSEIDRKVLAMYSRPPPRNESVNFLCKFSDAWRLARSVFGLTQNC